MRPKPAVLSLLLVLALPTSALATWSRVPTDNLLVATGSGNQLLPMLCPDGGGGVIVAWSDYGTQAAKAQRVSASGTLLWGAGVSVVDLPPFTSVAGAVSDGEGGAIVLCMHSATGASEDIVVQRLGPDGSRLWSAGGIAVMQNVGQASIASDGHQGAIVAFSKTLVDPADPQQFMDDIYAQRVDPFGALVWATNGVQVNPQFTNSRSFPQICADGSGGGVIAWQDVFGYDQRSVSLQRIDASGAALWNPGGVSTGAHGGEFLYHQLAGDGAGGGLVCWDDSRNAPAFPYTIYAQRVDGSGATQWGLTGMAVSSTPFYQDFRTAIIADGAGGGIISWGEDRTGKPIVDDSGLDLYMQRLDAAGTRRWGETGTAVSAAVGGQFAPRIISDAQGGAIVSWYDRRDFDPQIYIQRLGAAGKPQWKTDGVQVMNQPDYFEDLSMISDDDEGAILVWSDGRTPQHSIFAQRIRRNGKLGGPQGPKVDTDGLAPVTSIVRGSQMVLRFDLPSSGLVTIGLHDVAGRRMRTWREESLNAGAQELHLDVRDEQGRSLPSGLYLLDLGFVGRRFTQKIVVQR